MDNDLVKRQQRPAFVQDTHNDLFTELRRNRRDTEVDSAIFDLDRNTSVLWEAAFGDIKPRQNLETRRQRQLNLLRQNVFDVKHTVDAQPQDNTLLLRLD